MAAPVGIGLVGTGAFGEFCLTAFKEIAEVNIVAVADTDTARANRFGGQYGAHSYDSLDAMLADPDVEIVALNTPPFLHETQGLAALKAGKHLFCEKPLALTVEGGAALVEAAKVNHLRLAVDYVMRQNPLWEAAARLRESGLLGTLLHMSLSNHAAGQDLPKSHWFWDKARSGGIWIEHGVHFFDAFAWVAGQNGEIDTSRQFARADGVTDRVEALARFGNAAAHFYHGFTHSGVTEQTTVTLTFERGHLTLREWVPTILELVTPLPEAAMRPLLPGVVTTWPVSATMTRFTATLAEGKSAVYRTAIQAGMRDLARAVRDPSAPLPVTGTHGLDSLRMAVAAEQLGVSGSLPRSSAARS